METPDNKIVLQSSLESDTSSGLLPITPPLKPKISQHVGGNDADWDMEKGAPVGSEKIGPLQKQKA